MLPAGRVDDGRGLACEHCGLDVPQQRQGKDAEAFFCCAGCEMVYSAIHRYGLQQFYKHAREGGERRIAARVSGGRFAVWDDADFVARESQAGPNCDRQIELYLEGVHCSACLWLVERLPRVLAGVCEARLDIRRHVAVIRWRPEQVSLARIARTLDALGYAPHIYRGAAVDRLRRRENRSHLIRIGVAGACAGNAMLIAFALYGGMLNGMAVGFETLFRTSSLLVTLIALLGPGRIFLRGALAALRTRRAHMDLPVAIALTVGTAWGAWNTFSGAGEVYFESLTAIIFLLLIGRYLQHRQQNAAQDAVALLYSLTPSVAWLLRDTGEPLKVAVESLEPGQRIRLAPGDLLPVDGCVEQGCSRIDMSLLTGESQPVRVAVGDPVHAGCLNMTGPLEVRVLQTGHETRVGKLMRLVEEFSRDRPAIVLLADRVAERFVLIVLAAALLTGLAWAFRDAGQALEHAITLLIVTCPCALGLATPLAMQSAIGRAARVGILVKGGDALEQLTRPGRVWLDKTGTLTVGSMQVATWEGDRTAAALAAILERDLSHPIAKALMQEFSDPVEEQAAPRQAESVLHQPGAGIEGLVDGQRVRVGSPSYVREAVSEAPLWVRQAQRSMLSAGHTPIWIAVDGHVTTIVGLGDVVRQDAIACLDSLRAAGWSVGILSGDHPEIVARVAAEVGVPATQAHGAVAPEEKARIVREGVSSGLSVIMVGDGVNDAAALSAASVGIAVSGGTEASLAASDIFLTRPGLMPLVRLLRGAGRTMSAIRTNIIVSLAYNLIAGGLAMGGIIDPLMAAILMPISSLTVVGLSYRRQTFRELSRS